MSLTIPSNNLLELHEKSSFLTIEEIAYLLQGSIEIEEEEISNLLLFIEDMYGLDINGLIFSVESYGVKVNDNILLSIIYDAISKLTRNYDIKKIILYLKDKNISKKDIVNTISNEIDNYICLYEEKISECSKLIYENKNNILFIKKIKENLFKK